MASGTEQFALHAGKPVFLRVDTDRGYKRLFAFGGTVYYSATNANLTSAVNDGSIASGTSHLFTANVWLVTNGYVRCVATAQPDNPENEQDPIWHGPPSILRKYTSDQTDDISEVLDYDGTELGWMDSDGAFGVGPNPSFRGGASNGDYPATDFFVDARPLKGKVGTGDRGGTGRTNMRSFGVYMVNDPPDGNFHRAQGSPSGNFYDDVRTYTTGTVSVTSASDIVTGAGTLWNTSVNGRNNVLPGDAITIAGDTQTRTVQQVISNTSLKLASAYGGTTGGGKTYNTGGKVNVVNGSTTVTGVGTRWTTDLIDESFVLSGSSVTYRIVALDPDTQTLELTDSFGEDSVGESAYVIGFDGYPYGVNGDGSEMYECKNGAILMTLEGIPYMSAGGFNGGVGRISMSCAEDPFQHILDGHLKNSWAAGDSSVKVDVNPATFHIRQLNTRGEDQGTYPLREHGKVVITKDNGQSATVYYKAWYWDSGTQTGYLLGCTDTDTSGVGASVGKLVTQTRLHVGGRMRATTVPKLGYRLGETAWEVWDDAGMTFGDQASGARAAWHHIKGGQLRTDQMTEPSGASHSYHGTAAGAFERNYYFIFKNTSPGTSFYDVSVVKVNITDGQNVYGVTGYLDISLSSVPDGWLRYDVVKVDATAGVDSGVYKSIAENVSIRDDNKQTAIRAVDYGQIVTNPYTMPDKRNTTADVRVGGALTVVDGLLAPVNTQTNNYTLALTDAGLTVEMNSASARTITVPPSVDVAFPLGANVPIFRYGAGTVTVVAGAGVTIRSPGGLLTLKSQYSSGVLRKRATDEWVLSGDLL